MPRVLFSTPECRAIVVDLGEGEEMGDHQVRERAVVEVVNGRVEVESSGERVVCDAGTLLNFEPGEPHSVRALTDARLLLLLAPWPAPEHYEPSEDRGARLPANATVSPLPPEAA
jgi:quercetin dioxygenase-like cupin family protein